MLQIREEIRAANDYRQLVAMEFDRRKGKNLKYSLRAYARDLKISPSFLSEVLSGKSAFSKEQGQSWAQTMGFNDEEQDFVVTLVEVSEGRSETIRSAARVWLNRLRMDSDVEKLKIDAFVLIADWYHFAIVEVLRLSEAVHNIHWIAERLGILEPAVLASLRRLERLGFLKSREDGGYEILRPRTSVGGVPSEFIKNFHATVLEKATTALFYQPVECRDFSSTTIAFDSTLLPQYREIVADFRRKVVDLANSSDHKDTVYNLSVQMFQVSKPTPAVKAGE